MKNRIEYFFFYSFSRLFCTLGISKARKISGFLAFFFFYIIPIRRDVVISNLKSAFPDFSVSEIKEIAYRSYKNFAITLIEILCIPSLSKQEMISLVKLSDGSVELIKNLANQNKGLLICTAHFSNWEFAAISTSLQVNEPFYVIAKSQRNDLVDKWMNNAREKWLNKVVQLGISIRNVYAELKKGHMIGIVCDQRGPADGIRVNFFNRATSLFSGAGVLHSKLNSPLVIGIPVRQKDFTYSLEVIEIKTENMSKDSNQRVIEVLQEYASILERYIMKNPEQWLWMHKIWKY